jgi:hypothetical protein
LVELLGGNYARRTIFELESGRVTNAKSWSRYRAMCHAIHAQKYGWDKGRKFDWRA